MVLRLTAVDHPDTATYSKDFIASARAVASLAQVSWKDITVERIRRAVDKISKSKSFNAFIIYFSLLASVCSSHLSGFYSSVFRSGLEI